MQTSISTPCAPGDVAPIAEKRSGAPIFGALDLGTNNCRLMLGVPSSSGFRVIESFSRSVGLGEGLAETGQLAEPAMDRAMDALRSCASRLSRYRLSGLTAVATEACRRAANGADFLARVRQQTGLDIRIISGREEAELTLESCSPLLRGAGSRALVFDIGGGSTEIAWVRLEGGSQTLISFVSLPFGVMTLRACTEHSCFTEDGFNTMVETVEEKLWEFEDIHRIGREINRAGVRLLGTSGTITTVASVALKLPRYRRPLVDGILLPGEEADAAVDTLRAMGRSGLAAHPCIGEDRADLVLPGCAIFAAIRSVWPTPEVGVADRGLREGILLRQIRGGRRKDSRRNYGGGVLQTAIAASPAG
ncbi:MAG TPA: Ppx/GppA phosphatase family protein [Acidisoma sp.]|jgi:exopolyphosphatase/guanosine-5'-triphosphate,3'-diphosphate pyrophosphatase|nr:Ppx/GppA phosphatase family protein [Acidisoma sp.]